MCKQTKYEANTGHKNVSNICFYLKKIHLKYSTGIHVAANKKGTNVWKQSSYNRVLKAVFMKNLEHYLW